MEQVVAGSHHHCDFFHQFVPHSAIIQRQLLRRLGLEYALQTDAAVRLSVPLAQTHLLLVVVVVWKETFGDEEAGAQAVLEGEHQQLNQNRLTCRR